MFLKYMTTRYIKQNPKNLVPPFKSVFLKEHYMMIVILHLYITFCRILKFTPAKVIHSGRQLK